MYLIAEIGSNWDGDIQLAKDTIRECKEAGADAVKFQLWNTKIIYGDKWKDYFRWQMSFDQFKEVYEFSKEIGITCFATPSYPEAVDFLESLHVPLYKIASITSAQKHEYSLETMHKVADTGKPVIISYGYDDKTENIFKNNVNFELDCIPEYPAKMEDYPHPFSSYSGLSDHTLGTSLMIQYVRERPDVIIEKHVKLHNNSSPDNDFSLYVSELADFITLSKSSLFKLG